jgi:hypothetical protein
LFAAGQNVVGDVDDGDLENESAIVLSLPIDQVLAVHHLGSIYRDEGNVLQVLSKGDHASWLERRRGRFPAQMIDHKGEGGARLVGDELLISKVTSKLAQLILGSRDPANEDRGKGELLL